MKVGDLVRFKAHHYHKLYGIGILLGRDLQLPSPWNKRKSRHWAMFSDEHITVRLEELELVSESR